MRFQKGRYRDLFLIIGLLCLLLQGKVIAQNYDSCSDAIVLCPQKTFSMSNVGATSTGYNFGEDDFNFCFQPKKTIWLKFTTRDTIGNIEIKLSNLQFLTSVSGLNFNLIRTGYPCDGSTYVNDTCVSGILTNSIVSKDSLLPNTVYYICLSGVDTSSIVAEFIVDVSISGVAVDRPIPMISIWTPKSSICNGESVYINANLSNCPDAGQFRWFRNGDLFAVSDSNHIVTSNIQDGDVISVQNNCYTLCTDSVMSSLSPITVTDVDFQFSEDTVIAYGQPAVLNCYAVVDSIFWTPSNLVQFPDSVYTLAYPEESTTFYGKAYRNGCFMTKAIKVDIESEIKIFNTFSPNSDGINDHWNIFGIEKYPDAEVSIYTRWGQRVFFATNYKRSNAWDGTVSGKQLQPGTYFYVIDLKNSSSTKPIKGAVNLIK